jgi:hypothetical protein
MEKSQEDIQNVIMNEIKAQVPFQFKMEDISDKNFLFTREEECTNFLNGVNNLLDHYTKACTALQKIQRQLNSLTEAKSTTLKCTFIYKFIEMMKCYIDGFASPSLLDDFTKIKDLVQKFQKEVLTIIKIKKDDNIYKLKEEFNKFYKEKYSLINEQNKTFDHKSLFDKGLLNSVYDNVDPEIIKDIQKMNLF